MIRNSIKISTAVLSVFFLASCSHRLTGTWTVQRFETSKPGEQSILLQNIGTINFNKNNTGEKNISYTVLGLTNKDQKPFKWTWNDDKYVTIEGEGSEFAKSWIIISNKKKFQKWKSTDGTNNIQTIELVK